MLCHPGNVKELNAEMLLHSPGLKKSRQTRRLSLGAKRNRETLAQISRQHSRVIPTDHAKRGRALG